MGRQRLRHLALAFIFIQLKIVLLFSSVHSLNDGGAEEAIVSDLLQWLSDNGMRGVADGMSPTKVVDVWYINSIHHFSVQRCKLHDQVLIRVHHMGSCVLLMTWLLAVRCILFPAFLSAWCRATCVVPQQRSWTVSRKEDTHHTFRPILGPLNAWILKNAQSFRLILSFLSVRCNHRLISSCLCVLPSTGSRGISMVASRDITAGEQLFAVPPALQISSQAILREAVERGWVHPNVGEAG